MGDISKGVANTLQLAKKIYKKIKCLDRPNYNRVKRYQRIGLPAWKGNEMLYVKKIKFFDGF